MKTAMAFILARIEMLYIEKDSVHWEMYKNDCMEKEKEQMIDFAYGCTQHISKEDIEEYYNKTFKSESLGLKNCDVTLNNSLKNEPPYVSDDFQIGPDGAYEHTDEENTLTPKEKAEELVNKFREYANGDYDDGRFSPGIEKQNGKQCALIAVDELIEIACDYSDYDETVTKEYWDKVKIEIEKL